MKLFKIISATLIILSFSSQKTIAQTKNNAGSFYSSFGLGSLEASRNTQAEGLGLYGVAFDQTRVVGLANPALLSDYTFTTGTGSFNQTSYTGTQNGSSSSYSNFSFDGVSVVFPIMKGELGISASLTPMTYMNYIGQQVSTIPGDTLQGLSELKGVGGVSQFQFGIGYRISKNISIGYSPSYAFGSINQSNTTVFEDATYRSSLNGTNDFYSGLLHEIGVVYHQSSIVNKNDRALLGLSLRLPGTLNVTRYKETVIISNQFQQPISTKLSETSIDLPLSLKAGLTYYFNQSYLIATDMVYESWSTFKSLDQPSSLSYSNRLRLAIGGMFIPELRTSTNLFSSISLKAGVSYDSGYLNINGNSISKIAGHTGFSIPSPFTGSSIDMNFEYGILGSQSSSLVKEEVFSVKLILNLSEFMFFRRQLQ